MPRVPGASSVRKRKRKNIFMRQKAITLIKDGDGARLNSRLKKVLTMPIGEEKERKRVFRKLWIQRINAAAHELGLNYSQFISGLKKAGIIINRKMLADIALNNTDAFTSLVEKVRQQQGIPKTAA